MKSYWHLSLMVLVLTVASGGIFFAAHNSNQALTKLPSNLSDQSLATASNFLPTKTAPSTTDRIKPLDAYRDKIPETGRHTIIDLGTAEILMYEDGELYDSTTLKTQGEPGSFWQTPTGYYEIVYANQNHVSSIGNVNMPYSLQYSGNFFIHGWPTQLDGTPVGEGYSGGCIRLETANAKKVFDFMPVGSKVLVINSKNLTSTNASKSIKTNLENFNLQAKNYLMANLATGEVFAKKATNNEIELGYLGNFIIAMTANEWISYGTAINQYQTNGSSFYPTGNSLVLRDIYPSLLSNSAASNSQNYALAKHRGEWFFAEKVIDKVASIGMNDTTLITKPGNAEPLLLSAPMDDWFHLVRYLHFQKPFLLEAASTVVEAQNTQSFQFTTKNQTESGFAIITKPNLDPIVVLINSADDFAHQIDKVTQALTN